MYGVSGELLNFTARFNYHMSDSTSTTVLFLPVAWEHVLDNTEGSYQSENSDSKSVRTAPEAVVLEDAGSHTTILKGCEQKLCAVYQALNNGFMASWRSNVRYFWPLHPVAEGEICSLVWHFIVVTSSKSKTYVILYIELSLSGWTSFV